MNNWAKWSVLPAIVCVCPAASYAVTYLTVEQAQEAIFPGAKLTSADVHLTEAQRKGIEKSSGIRVRNADQKIWKTSQGEWFLLDEVLGKHEYISYAVGLAADGSVKQVEVLDYRETYGSEIRNEKWRAQFVGKNSKSKLVLDEDIKNISGATLSSRHITDGVKRLLALYDLVLK